MRSFQAEPTACTIAVEVPAARNCHMLKDPQISKCGLSRREWPEVRPRSEAGLNLKALKNLTNL